MQIYIIDVSLPYNWRSITSALNTTSELYFILGIEPKQRLFNSCGLNAYCDFDIRLNNSLSFY